jgi:hypothetical protein
MAFPIDILDLSGEIYVDGAWEDISEYIYGLNGMNAFAISGGYANEAKSLQPSTCAFRLSSPEGRFYNRNPLSPYYGKLPRNVPFRVRVDSSDPYVRASFTDDANIFTIDKAALDITGDIDIRIDIEPDTFTPAYDQCLAMKYDTNGNQRSWYFYLNSSGNLGFVNSSDGTSAGRVFYTSTAPVPTTNARISVRVLLDVNNGSGGKTAYFSYSTTGVSGSWTLLGSAVTTAGTTSIFSSSAAMYVGTVLSAGAVSNLNSYQGKIYEFRLLNSAGTVVASPDFTTLNMMDKQITDAQSNVFLLDGPVFVRDDSLKFAGEISKFPLQADSTNTEVFSNVSSAGITRRLTQGQQPLRSPIYRNLSQYETQGYFPMEDSDGATSVANEAGNAAIATGISFTSDEDLRGSAGCLVIDVNTARVTGVTTSSSNTGSANGVFFAKMNATPGSDTLFMRFYGTGTVRRWDIYATSTNYRVDGYGADGSVITTDTLAYGDVNPTVWAAYDLELTTSGGNVSWAMNAVKVGDSIAYTTGGATVAGSVGRYTGFLIAATTNLVGARYAHVFLTTLANLPFVDADFYSAAAAYVGETAVKRMTRLSLEEEINFSFLGDGNDSEVMGYQKIDTYVNLMEECAKLDDGLLFEPVDFIGYEYITRYKMINQSSAFTLSMTDDHLSPDFLPIDDDQKVRNDVTVTRAAGSSGRVVQTEGPNTPELIGVYDESLELSAYEDARLVYLAGWRVFLGTWDEPRYEQVYMQLSRKPFVDDPDLTAELQKPSVGKVGTVTDLPLYQSPNDVEFMVVGYDLRLGQAQYDIKWNAVAYGPYKANDLDVGVEDRADAEDSELVSGVNTTNTSLSVTATLDPLWITTALYASEFPFDIFVGGERMTVTAISGTSFPQTFTVTRSVNGVVKSHLSGAAVTVADPFYATL